MLEKMHFIVDGRYFKCCFSSTMNLMATIQQTALRTRSGNLMGGMILGATVLIVASCSSSGPRNYSDASPLSAAKERSAGSFKPTGSGVRSEEAFATRAKERPGLATTWGDSVKMPMTDTRFSRSTSQPVGVDAIFYNNHEGLEAMGAKDMDVGGMQQAAGGIIEWGIKGSIGMLPAYKSYTNNGYRRFVQGSSGASYSIVIKNVCKCRVQVILSVDGLDVLDGKPASMNRAGYVIEPGKTLEVEGFRTSFDRVAEFQFSSVSQSYANLRHGDTRNVGVIGLAAYTEKGADPWTWMPIEVNQRQTANPFATAR
jgi:hypothetical protein